MGTDIGPDMNTVKETNISDNSANYKRDYSYIEFTPASKSQA